MTSVVSRVRPVSRRNLGNAHKAANFNATRAGDKRSSRAQTRHKPRTVGCQHPGSHDLANQHDIEPRHHFGNVATVDRRVWGLSRVLRNSSIALAIADCRATAGAFIIEACTASLRSRCRSSWPWPQPYTEISPWFRQSPPIFCVTTARFEQVSMPPGREHTSRPTSGWRTPRASAG